jgi:hypothetical protein
MLERVSARSNKYGMFFPSNLKANLIPMPSHVVMEPRNNPFRLYYVLRWLFCTLLPGRILEILTQFYRYPLVLDHEEVLDGHHHELPLPNRRHSSTLRMEPESPFSGSGFDHPPRLQRHHQCPRLQIGLWARRRFIDQLGRHPNYA